MHLRVWVCDFFLRMAKYVIDPSCLGRKPISVDSKISEVPVSYLGLHGVMNYCPLQDPSDPQRNFSLYPSVMEGA